MALRDPRWYVGLGTLKNELGITDTSHDAKLKRYIERASALIEQETGRTFQPVTATRKFDVPDPALPRGAVYLNDDLLTVSSISDASGAIGGYYLYPANRKPKGRVEYDSWTWTDSRQQAIAIAGDWGYGDDYEDSGTTLATAISSTTATTLSASDGSLLEVGWTLLIDSERLFVKSIVGNTVTVQRATGGSTAATHTLGTVIYRYTPNADIVEACVMLAGTWHAWRESGGVTSETIGNYSVSYAGGWPVPDTVTQMFARLKRQTYR